MVTLDQASSFVVDLLYFVFVLINLFIKATHLSEVLFLDWLLFFCLQLRYFSFGGNLLIFKFWPFAVMVLVKVSVLIILWLLLLLLVPPITTVVLASIVATTTTSIVASLLRIEILCVSLMFHTTY